MKMKLFDEDATVIVIKKYLILIGGQNDSSF